VKYNYFKNNFEGMDLLKSLIEKLAFDSLNSDDIKKSYGISFYSKHITGESKVIKDLQKTISRVGKDPDISVVIYGETGTGKEVIARLLHNESGRSGMFVALNCTALPDTLMESLLFGYVKGAHSTAIEDKKGIFEEADGGTVFLDEIGDMPLHLQAKLLRVLEEREITRIGAEARAIPVDFRLICATNKNLKQMVKENKFRQDLYFRIARYEITIPPLRERKEDIELIAIEILYDFYLRGKCPRIILNKKQIEALKSYSWRGGNIRELQKFLEGAIIDNDFDFEKRIEKYKKENSIFETQETDLKKLDDIEKEAIIKTLNAYSGNKSKAAHTLGISLNTLKAKMRKYCIK
jgi:transcriptional regulator with PAS, ATPase and Fis domain